MRFNGICLVSLNARQLRDFRRTALRAEAEGNDTSVKSKNAGAVLAVFCKSGMGEMAPDSTETYGHGGFTTEFEVENVDEEYERLKTLNVPIVKLPTTQPWGRCSLWFRDPDGNIVNFFSTVSR